MERSRPKAPFVAKLVFGAVLLILHLPLLFLFGSSFFEKSASGWAFTLKWFQEVLQDQSLLRAFANSMLIGFSASTAATLLGTAGALALHRGGFLGARFFRGLSFASLLLPEIVFALALLAWFFVLGLSLGLQTVIVAHVTFLLAYVILIVSARLTLMDSSLQDAARDLGASEWSILGRIVLPMILPSIGAAFLLSFLLSFDDFLITFFVNGAGQDTLPVKLYTSMKMGLTPKLNALATMMWLVSVAVLIFAFRSSSFRDVLKAGEAAHEHKN